MKKKILITGCMGHLGFAITSYISKYYSVVGIYNKSIDLNKKNFLLAQKVKLIQNNLKDKKILSQIIKKNNITDCIYASAIAHDSLAVKKPEQTVFVNSLYPNFFLDFIKKNILKKFIYLSTGSVFQNIKSRKIKINEAVIPSPQSLYALSKRTFEIQLENCFNNILKKKACILRVSWIYGPPMLTNKIIPQRGPLAYVINEILKKNKKKIYLPGKDFCASFTYIDDVCESILNLINKKFFFCSVYHLGTGTNNKVVEIISILKKKFPLIQFLTSKGFSPWSNNSVVRGPLVSKHGKNALKTKYNLNGGISEFLRYYQKNA